MEQIRTGTDIDHRGLFENPTAAFRPSAYWFWHSIPTEEVCLAQLSDFKLKGIGTILIQARLAMSREDYLSPAYLEAYRTAAGIAARLGLKLGIYDDYNWISGHAGGRTVAGRDDLRERHLFWSSSGTARGEISGIHPPFTRMMGADIIEWQYEGSVVKWCEWTVAAALLHSSATIESLDEVVDVTARTSIVDSVDAACVYAFDGTVGDGQMLTVFVSARSTTSRLINYLLPEAAERFIAVGLDPLIEMLGDLVPDPVSFVFYDQPAAGFYKWDQIRGSLGNSLLFAPSLIGAVSSRTGESFAKALLALVHDVGSATLQLRAGFYAAYSGLMNEAFFGTLRGWAESRCIELTGHEILPHISSWSLNGGFTSIDPRVALAVDFFGIDAYRHQTAVDSNNFVAQLAPKIGDSVARSNGRSRCIVETYASAERTPVRAAGQWELTLETMRAQAIRLYCLGTRQFLWHGVYQTDGRDHDPTPFANPRFDFGPGINFEPWWSYHDLFAQETARISAFIEPATPRAPMAILYPLQTAFAEGPRHSHATHIGAWCEGLLAKRCDFMFVSEADLIKARIDGGRMLVSGLAFDAVILPSVSVLQTGETVRVLNAFSAAGGVVVSSGDRLSTVCDAAIRMDAVVSMHIDRIPGSSDIETLLAALPSFGPVIAGRAVEMPWQWIGHEADGWWRIVLFNDGAMPVISEISFGDGFDCEVWSAATGKTERAAAFNRLTVTLEPQEVRCLRLRQTTERAIGAGHLTTRPPLDLARSISLVEGWSFAPEGDTNFVPISVESGWEMQGFAEFSGTGIYRLALEIGDEAEWFLELPEVATVVAARLDGRQVDRLGWRPYRFSLGRLQPGVHSLELRVANTAANRYYADTPYLGDTVDKSGLSAAPKLIPLIH
ncbi:MULTISPECIES: carbohydrate-binding protein [unclassified Rhizobium]|uniref:carbohydrate-binding protein n=1 Tax=unclassified Rhizobium TaxID=2613769 RepID=UPI000EA8F5F0|nr:MULTISPECIES: carbohydrate-binding protein [unclassified Rhizobium]AYG70125.1 carbohydrate-binding protein [Rhizobium sp. CCGE531]AYG76500.1 carbohydrate-binding protein [Rhizobium sp. CCGE532]